MIEMKCEKYIYIFHREKKERIVHTREARERTKERTIKRLKLFPVKQ
jgi:hypothetical protein